MKIDLVKVNALLDAAARATGTLRADADFFARDGETKLSAQTRAMAEELRAAMVAVQSNVSAVEVAKELAAIDRKTDAFWKSVGRKRPEVKR